MKSCLKIFTVFITVSVFSMVALARDQSADSTGLPGDHFDLRGALAMFKKASSPEEFEKLINTEDNPVNNLDLNGDGEVDYIRVIDQSEKDLHALVLQVPVSEKEKQDIAVIEIEKTGDSSAILQIIGDEDIYGEQVIIEPDGGGTDDALINGWNSADSGPSALLTDHLPRFVINVWFWPSVRFIYTPVYRPWISPWRWRVYPGWWRPWRPLHWHVWHPRRIHYHSGFVLVRTHRVHRAHLVYTPYRASSVTVRTRHAGAVNNYRVTRTKTTVTGPRGRSATKTTTTIKGRGGKVKARRTKVRRH